MAGKCIEGLGNQINQVKLDAKAVARPFEDKLIKTDFGTITIDTKFVPGRGDVLLGFKYKNWTIKKGIPFVSKGNNPLLYEREFLQTLTKEDFRGLQDLVPQQTLSYTQWAKKVTTEPLTKLSDLSGGRQRLTSLMELPDGTRVVQKTYAGARQVLAEEQIGNELLFSDVARDLGIDIAPKVVKLSGNALIQEYSVLPVASSIRVESGILNNQVNLFIKGTKQGKDWNFLDVLFNATDRHEGNYALQFKNSKVSGVSLLDNNDILSPSVTSAKSSVLNKLAPQTEIAFKKWLSKLGWSEKSSNWDLVRDNIDDMLTEYRGIRDKAATNAFVGRIKDVVANGFAVPTWQKFGSLVA
jgi:hypothetical protein